MWGFGILWQNIGNEDLYFVLDVTSSSSTLGNVPH
jgi:hypothetical protein